MNVLRGIVKSVTHSAGKLSVATVSGFGDQELEDVEVFLQDGMGTLRAGTECVLIKIGPDWLLIASADRSENIAIANGDKVIYTADGQYIKLKRAGGIEIKSTGAVTINGHLEVAAP